MIKVKCHFLLLVLVISFNCSVLCMGFHPMVISLAPKTVPDSVATSSEEQNYLVNDEAFNSDKRSPPHLNNKIRFSQSEAPLVSASYSSQLNPINEDKRVTRNFLRFGRNFLRFGQGGPLENALGLKSDPSEDLVKRGYGQNFLRFGKSYDRNYLRYGRSIDEEQQQVDDELTDEKIRKKRSIMHESNAPISDTWAYSLGQELPIAEKRGYSARNFLRYGRDPLDLHFIRFGKRTDPSKDNYNEMERVYI